METMVRHCRHFDVDIWVKKCSCPLQNAFIDTDINMLPCIQMNMRKHKCDYYED